MTVVNRESFANHRPASRHDFCPIRALVLKRGARTGCSEAAVGSARRWIAGRRTETGTRRSTGASTSASAFPSSQFAEPSNAERGWTTSSNCLPSGLTGRRQQLAATLFKKRCFRPVKPDGELRTFRCHFCSCQLWSRWHEASGNHFGTLLGSHSILRNKTYARSKRHNTKLLTSQDTPCRRRDLFFRCSRYRFSTVNHNPTRQRGTHACTFGYEKSATSKRGRHVKT